MSKSKKRPREKPVTRKSKSGKTTWHDPLGADWTPPKESKYKPEFCQAIIISSHKGKYLEEFASSIGVHRDTLYAWAEAHPEFKAAMAKAKQEAEVYMIKLIRKSTLGMRLGKKGHTRSINWPMLIFQMKARFGWREEPVEQNDDGDVEFDFE